MFVLFKKPQHHKTDDREEGGSRQSLKTVENDFYGIPHLKMFAIYAKSYFQTQAAFGSAFPLRGPVERHDFILKLLNDVANEPSSDTTVEAYTALVTNLSSNNKELFERLCTFVRVPSFPLPLIEITDYLGDVWKGPINQFTNH